MALDVKSVPGGEFVFDPAAFSELVAAADGGDPEGLQELLQQASAEKLRVASSNLLQAAVCLGSSEAVRLVSDAYRKAGCSLDALDAMGFSPVHAAVATGFEDCIRPLLTARADIGAKTADASFCMGQSSIIYAAGGRTALHIAVENADDAAARKLMECGGASITGERDSFGMLPRDQLLEAAALTDVSSKRFAKLLRVAEALGLDDDLVAAAQAPDRQAVEAQQRARQRSLQARIAEQEQRKASASRAMFLCEVRERYVPLDAELLRGELGSSVSSAELAQRLAGPSREGFVQPCPGVFAFRLLPEPLCDRVWAESENYVVRARELDLPMPVRHDGGLDLSVVFPDLVRAVADAALPAVRALLPPELHDVSLQHAFRTKNFVGRDERFVRHVDKHAVTLNVCLRKTFDVRGSGVFFFESQDAKAASYRHEHEVGLAVLHSSKAWHQTEPLTLGERGSLILWFSCN